MKTMILLIPLLVVVCATAALASEAAVKVSESTVEVLREHSDVRMVSANVSADIYATESRVCCEYLLKNEGEGQWVTLGFPDIAECPRMLADGSHLRNFCSWADGKRLQSKLYSRPFKSLEKPGRWYVRRVWFAHGQSRKIVNSYIQPNGRFADGLSRFFYLIRTAGSWKGRVGTVNINVQWREPYLWKLDVPIAPEGEEEQWPRRYASASERTLSWTWSNWEPAEYRWSIDNILLVDFSPGWSNTKLDGNFMKVGKDGAWFLVYSDLTMAPVRHLAEILDLICVWEHGHLTVTGRGQNSFVCRLGSTAAIANGKFIALRKTPVLWRTPGFEEHHMYAPLRPICEAFGVQCSLDYEKYAVVLNHEKPPVVAQEP